MDKTMLIVDDGLMNREILKRLFGDEYNVFEAKNGEEALHALEEHQDAIDIVLLDLVMPGMSGLDLLERRQSIPYFKSIPVVVITSSEDMTDQVKAFELGASDFVAKPFVPQVVQSRINSVMTSRAQYMSIQKEAQKLKYKSEVDEMTGLLNKVTTEAVIGDVLETETDATHVLMIIDLDNFKTVNDTLGHQEGDHVIKVVSRLLNAHFRKTDIVGRIGGDEFCVLMKDIPNREIVYQKVNELIQLMRFKPGIPIPDYVTLSIGLVTNEGKYSTYKDMFKKADAALYLVKQRGKGNFQEYGVAPTDQTVDERPVVVLISKNRSVCSAAYGVITTRLHIIVVADVQAAGEIEDKEKENVQMMFADVSEYTGSTQEVWQEIEKFDWISMERVFAICQEGNRTQYMEALAGGAADIFTTPVEVEAFKNRVRRVIERLQIELGK